MALTSKRTFASETMRVTVVTAFARGVGFLIPFVIARVFGATQATDAFFLAYAWVLFASTVLSPALESLVVPYIAEAETESVDGDGGAEGFVFTLSILSVAVGLILGALLAAGSTVVMPLVTALDDEAVREVVRLMWVGFPLVALTAVSSLFAGALNARRDFLVAASSPFLRAIVIIAAIVVLKERMGVTSVMVGYVGGEAARTLLLLVRLVLKGGIGFNAQTSLLSQRVIHFARTGAFQIAGTVSIGFVPLVDKAMASWLGSGSVSLMEYGYRLYLVPATLIGSGVVVTSLSHWSSTYFGAGHEQLMAEVRPVVRKVASVSAVLALGFGVAAVPVVAVVYGGLAPQDTRTVILVFVAYLLGLVPFVVGQLLNRALLVMRDTTFLFWVTVAANVSNVALNLLFMRVFGLVGIALSSAGTAMLMYLVLRTRLGRTTSAAAHR